MSEESAGRAFINETRSKAIEVTTHNHVSEEVKSIIKDLLQIIQNIETLQNQSMGQSADSRVLKKRWDQAKIEMRALENKHEATQKAVVAIIEEVKTAAVEAGAITKRHPTPNDPDSLSAQKIRACAQKIADALVQAIKS